MLPFPIFLRKVDPVNVHHIHTQFPAPRSKRNNRAIPQFESGRFWCTSVHKLTPRKEIGTWRRRSLVYQPVTGRCWKTGLKCSCEPQQVHQSATAVSLQRATSAAERAPACLASVNVQHVHAIVSVSIYQANYRSCLTNYSHKPRWPEVRSINNNNTGECGLLPKYYDHRMKCRCSHLRCLASIFPPAALC